MSFENCMRNVRSACPLIHNITNYVTVNDVANILLACGGSPIMAVTALLCVAYRKFACGNKKGERCA